MNKDLSELVKEKSNQLEDAISKIAEVFPYSREEIISVINWSEQLHSKIEEEKLITTMSAESSGNSFRKVLEQIRVQGV